MEISIENAQMAGQAQKVIDRLKRWCRAPDGWGRQTEVAKYLAKERVVKHDSPQIITDWFSKSRKRNPTADQILAVIKFLDDRGAPH